MWVLVVGKDGDREQEGRAIPALAQLGCRTRGADLWDPFDDATLAAQPPGAILVEALDEVDAGRAALERLRRVSALVNVPALCAVSTRGLSRLNERDSFDDFVLFPYVPAELVLRLRAADWARSEFSGPDRIKVGALSIDALAHEVTVDGAVIDLTAKEFSLLQFLAQHRGRVFSRDQLLQRVWGVSHYGESRTVDIHVRRIRSKLGVGTGWVKTVRGVGYKFVEAT